MTTEGSKATKNIKHRTFNIFLCATFECFRLVFLKIQTGYKKYWGVGRNNKSNEYFT